MPKVNFSWNWIPGIFTWINVLSRKGVCALCHGRQSLRSARSHVPDDLPGSVLSRGHHCRPSKPRHRTKFWVFEAAPAVRAESQSRERENPSDDEHESRQWPQHPSVTSEWFTFYITRNNPAQTNVSWCPHLSTSLAFLPSQWYTVLLYLYVSFSSS